VLTFAIRPVLFEDDGLEAFEQLKRRMEEELRNKPAASRKGLLPSEEEDG
jgi:hypothetical protein